MSLRTRRAVLGGVLAAALALGVSIFWWVRGHHKMGARTNGLVTSISRARGKILELEAPEQQAEIAVWIDVMHPAPTFEALRRNPWIQNVLQEPLGKGFLGSWTPLLNSRGEELGSAFQGTVAEILVTQLIRKPFRLVWFQGRQESGTAALTLLDPGAGENSAFQALDNAANAGRVEVSNCPSQAVAQTPISIQRWSIAEHVIYAARAGDRMVFSRQPFPVIQALCLKKEQLQISSGKGDLELGISPLSFGREAETLASVLGIEGPVILSFHLEGQRIVPTGLRGILQHPQRLASGPLSETLLSLIPEDMPVVLTAQLNLPESLDSTSLVNFWGKDKGKGKVDPILARQLAILWNPQGDAGTGVEVALIWSRPADSRDLAEIVQGSAFKKAVLCGQQVFASTPELIRHLASTCQGKTPSLNHAAADVLNGFKAPQSIGLGIATGKILANLMGDGFHSMHPKAQVSPEIEDARKRLEDLPYLGFTGTVRGDALLGEGFSQ